MNDVPSSDSEQNDQEGANPTTSSSTPLVVSPSPGQSQIRDPGRFETSSTQQTRPPGSSQSPTKAAGSVVANASAPGAPPEVPVASGQSSEPVSPSAPTDAIVESTIDGVADSESAGPISTPSPQRVENPLVESEGSTQPPGQLRIFAVANQKGGVGKTTTTVNLGSCFAELGLRTLIVDLDPQANASTGLGINPRSIESSMYDVLLHDTPLEDCVEATAVKNLFCAPASLDLAGAEIELVPAFNRERRLKAAIESVADDYDYVLIDCPPSLGLLTVNGLTAATEVLVPIQCEYYALEGLGQLLRNVDLVKKNLNPELDLSTIVLVMFDARTKLASQVAKEVRDHFGPVVCRQVIPRSVRLSEAPSFGQPINVFDPTSRGSIAYRDLAREVSGVQG